MKTKKLLSILLALMMMLSVVPMYASAADPIALSASNVTEWPTANGEIYVGQILGEHITLVGGKVIYEGVEVHLKEEGYDVEEILVPFDRNKMLETIEMSDMPDKDTIKRFVR